MNIKQARKLAAVAWLLKKLGIIGFSEYDKLCDNLTIAVNKLDG